MDIGGLPSKIANIAEKNASILSFGLTSYARRAEIGTDDAIPDLLRYFTFGSNYWSSNPLKEVMAVSQGNILQNLTWKFWSAPHLNTQLFKISALAYIAGEYFGLINGKWVDIAKKVAIGSGLSALLMPSSGASETLTGNAQGMRNQFTASYTQSPLQGSTLNQAGDVRTAGSGYYGSTPRLTGN